MNKFIISAAAGLIALSAAAASSDTVQSVRLTGHELTAAETISDGKQYLIYDGDVSNNQRWAFRFSTDNGAGINGTHIERNTNNYNLSAYHVWEAEEQTDGTFKFKNVANQRYIGALTYGGNSGLSDEGETFTVSNYPNRTDNAKKVVGSTNSYAMDGNAGNTWALAGWTGDGHPIYFYSLEDNAENWSSITYYHVTSTLKNAEGETYATQETYILNGNNFTPTIWGQWPMSSSVAIPAKITEPTDITLRSIVTAGAEAKRGQTLTLSGSLTAATTVTPGKKYLIYDAMKLNADGTQGGNDAEKNATAFRGTRSGDNVITGNHDAQPTSASTLPAHAYVWTAEGTEDAISFKNEWKNAYIPAAVDAVMNLSETPGTFEFISYANSFIVKNTTNNCVWDGDNGQRDPHYRMVGWTKQDDYNINHAYRFYEVTDDMLSDNDTYQIIYVTKVGDVETVVYNNYLASGAAMPETPSTEEFAIPANFPSTVTAPGRYVFTTKRSAPEGSIPVRIANAFDNNGWLNTSATTLTHGNEESAEIFYQVNTTNGFKLYSLMADKWVGTIKTDPNSSPIDLVSGKNEAQELQFIRLIDGTEAISNAGNSNLEEKYFLNLRTNNAMGSWDVVCDDGSIDKGCRYFMIYDDDTYATNKTQYNHNAASWGGNLYTALTAAKERVPLLEGVTDEAVTALNDVIAKADTIRFGVKGNDIAAIIAQLNAAVTATDELADFTDRAIARYAELVGVSHELGGNITVPGYAYCGHEKIQALYNAITADPKDNDAIRAAYLAVESDDNSLNAFANTNHAAFYTEGAIYTVRSTDLSARGYLWADATGNLTNTTHRDGSNEVYDATDDGYHFVMIPAPGNKKVYLYNVSAQKFVNAYGEAPTNSTFAAAAHHTWQLSDMPTPLDLVPFRGATIHSIVIRGGQFVEGNHYANQPGMTLVNSGDHRALVTMGVTDDGDGCGLYIAYAGQVSADELAEIKAKAQAANEVAESHWNGLLTNEEDRHIVNHLSFAAASAARTAFEATSGDIYKTADFKHYLIGQGERQGVQEGGVYTLIDEDGMARYCDHNVQGLKQYTEEATNDVPEPNIFRWVVTTAPAAVEGEIAAQAEGDVSYIFAHPYIEHDRPTIMDIDGSTVHTLGTDNFGKVTINGKDYTMQFVSADDTDAKTTEIREISAEGNGSETVIYDLQGRRLTKPGHGIYIINGVKTRL